MDGPEKESRLETETYMELVVRNDGRIHQSYLIN
jgi:hypothetical protein